MQSVNQLHIKILIVEDFHAETEALLRELEGAELLYTHEIVHSEDEFRQKLRAEEPDIILSPYSLKKTNAVKLLAMARKEGCSSPFYYSPMTSLKILQ